MKQKGILETLKDFGVEPSDIFKGFMQAMAEMANDGWGQSSDNSENYDEESEDEDKAEGEEEYAFPMLQGFDPFQMDSDDPRLSRGVDFSGIPEALAVRSNEEQDKLIPLVDGRFISQDFES